jgi:protein gp37
MDLWGATKRRKQQSEHYWNEPLRWNRAAEKAGTPAYVFCSSMADVFEDHPDLVAPRARLWPLIEATPWLLWLLLTKRAENLLTMVPESWRAGWPKNAFPGVTAATQEWADRRVPVLLRVPARGHWISAEPLLGPIDFTRWMPGYKHAVTDDLLDAPDGAVVDGEERVIDVWHRRIGLAQIIVGGESGHGARLMKQEWAKDILDQCRRYGVAYWFKQKGEALARAMGCKDKAGKDPSEWPAEFRVQEHPVFA